MNYIDSNLKVVGTRPIRPDGVDKVTGRAVFAADTRASGMLWGKILRSPHAHARIVSIDTAKAEALPGVRAVVTSADFPDIKSEEAFVGEGPMNFRDLSRNCLARDKALYDGHAVAAVAAVLPATADPAAPQSVSVADPIDALTARVDATAAFGGLFLALGAVALLVGGIGIANVMVIAVLERRGEIGLRRALGARRLHVAIQFAAEATVLAGCGGAAGAVLGGFATTVYATARHWDAVVPVPVLLAATGVAVATGAAAGLYPAWRAARLVPAEALRLG